MRYFLVHTVVTMLEGEGDGELARLRSAEVARAKELQKAGVLEALWRETGRFASYGLWRASSESDLRAVVATLPMHRYMKVEMVEIEQHPNAIGTFPFRTADCRGPVS